jgi:anti-sigma regulatory factor (Ser/Thr protein kinase)
VSLELELPRQLESAAAARHAVEGLAEDIGEQLGDVRLLVSELVTNSLRHAQAGPDESIRLTVLADAARVRVEVSDPGEGFQLSGSADDQDAVEGWGLYLVATLSDRWGVDRAADRTASSVWFELDR